MPAAARRAPGKAGTRNTLRPEDVPATITVVQNAPQIPVSDAKVYPGQGQTALLFEVRGVARHAVEQGYLVLEQADGGRVTVAPGEWARYELSATRMLAT